MFHDPGRSFQTNRLTDATNTQHHRLIISCDPREYRRLFNQPPVYRLTLIFIHRCRLMYSIIEDQPEILLQASLRTGFRRLERNAEYACIVNRFSTQKSRYHVENASEKHRIYSELQNVCSSTFEELQLCDKSFRDAVEANRFAIEHHVPINSFSFLTLIVFAGECISLSGCGETRARPRWSGKSPCRDESRVSRSRLFGCFGEHLLHVGTVRRHQIRRSRAENRQ